MPYVITRYREIHIYYIKFFILIEYSSATNVNKYFFKFVILITTYAYKKQNVPSNFAECTRGLCSIVFG